MRTLDINLVRIKMALVQLFIVALYSNLLHQVPHKDGDVVWSDDGILHRGIVAVLAVLAVAPHLDDALPGLQAHVENHHDSVGRPASSTLRALKPSKIIDISTQYTSVHRFGLFCFTQLVLLSLFLIFPIQTLTMCSYLPSTHKNYTCSITKQLLTRFLLHECCKHAREIGAIWLVRNEISYCLCYRKTP